MDEKYLLDLYKTTVTEHRACADDHHKRIVWFIGLLSALGTATITGFYKATSVYHYIVLITGPLTMIFVSKIARNGTARIYQRFLECISFRAKLEYHLGLMKKGESNTAIPITYFGNETMVPCRHIEPFTKADSTEDWLEKHKKIGYQKSANRLFNGTIVLSIYLLLIIVFKLIKSFYA